MSTTYNAKVILSVEMRQIISDGVQKGVVPAKILEQLDLARGTSNGQINVAYYDRVTGIGAAVTTVYDLIGSLTNLEGTTLNFDEVVLVVVKNLSSTAANYLSVGPDATAGFGVVASNQGFFSAATDRNIVSADSWLCMYNEAGVAAAAGASDELAIITQGGTSSNTWDLLILGRDN